MDPPKSGLRFNLDLPQLVSDYLLLSYPKFKSIATLGYRFFTCPTPKLPNVLPLQIRSAESVGS